MTGDASRSPAPVEVALLEAGERAALAGLGGVPLRGHGAVPRETTA